MDLLFDYSNNAKERISVSKWRQYTFQLIFSRPHLTCTFYDLNVIYEFAKATLSQIVTAFQITIKKWQPPPFTSNFSLFFEMATILNNSRFSYLCFTVLLKQANNWFLC